MAAKKIREEGRRGTRVGGLGFSVGTMFTSPSPLSKPHQLRLGSARPLLSHTCDRWAHHFQQICARSPVIISTHVIGSTSPPPAICARLG
ncbi:hypothetical protein Pyn_18248 [Prunus yedoensis var. nudiflora]|uniref:Uncharacterized protein n=1 Tax=Prunus yedoensis var. nudiflora TaxID=2094558 RepID=A0A314XRV7_PRUYE|nr:hypothetical protein Pyn_18248 [Prunus yedoensis var. nudiflora]